MICALQTIGSDSTQLFQDCASSYISGGWARRGGEGAVLLSELGSTAQMMVTQGDSSLEIDHDLDSATAFGGRCRLNELR